MHAFWIERLVRTFAFSAENKANDFKLRHYRISGVYDSAEPKIAVLVALQ
jgi:hypothetical protein